jgi:hypothetical protein
MATCRRCNGEGWETYEEDGRQVRDACYHCGTSGQVEEELDFQDRLFDALGALAHDQEREYRQACEADPDGDNYDLCAAENGMSPWDWFKTRVWDRRYVLERELPIHHRALFVAIYEGWTSEPWAEDEDAKVRMAELDMEHDDRHLDLAEEWPGFNDIQAEMDPSLRSALIDRALDRALDRDHEPGCSADIDDEIPF